MMEAQTLAIQELENTLVDEGQRPWGSFEILLDNSRVKVKRLIVQPGQRLSLQKHRFRQEHWVCVDGRGQATLGKKNVELSRGKEIIIPRGSLHRLQNHGSQPLIVIETQIGDYFGEDDIIRIQDDYKRS